MTNAKTKTKKELEQQVKELTADLQRLRADFENYHKRTNSERLVGWNDGRRQTIIDLLPLIDSIERATGQVPAHLQDDAWASGVLGVGKKLSASLEKLGVVRIRVVAGVTEFDPSLHEAISTDDSQGEREIIAEQLQAGYCLGKGDVLRPTMVRTTRQ